MSVELIVEELERLAISSGKARFPWENVAYYGAGGDHTICEYFKPYGWTLLIVDGDEYDPDDSPDEEDENDEEVVASYCPTDVNLPPKPDRRIVRLSSLVENKIVRDFADFISEDAVPVTYRPGYDPEQWHVDLLAKANPNLTFTATDGGIRVDAERTRLIPIFALGLGCDYPVVEALRFA